MSRCADPSCTDGPPGTEGQPLPRFTVEPSRLCVRCGGMLERRLAEIPAHATALRAVLGGLRSSVRGGSRPTKGEPPVPLNIAAHDHLTAMKATLVSWVRLVCEERDLRGPDRDDLDVLSGWLLSQIGWLLQHDAVGDLADEVRDLTRVADGLTHLTRRPVRAGCDCFGCGEPLWRGVADGLEADRVTCSACGTTYDDGQYLMALKAAAWDAAWIEVDGEQWATSAALANALGRPEQTIRSWYRRGHVRSMTHGGCVFVHVKEAETRHSTGAAPLVA